MKRWHWIGWKINKRMGEGKDSSSREHERWEKTLSDGEKDGA